MSHYVVAHRRLPDCAPIPLPLSTDTNDISSCSAAELTQIEEENQQLDAAVELAVHDSSPIAKKGRRNAMVRAVFGELIGTTILLYITLAVVVHTSLNNFGPGASAIAVALAVSTAVIALIYTFADVSGAHFNPAITFATWITRRTSNRKFIFYIVAQLIGSIFACIGVSSTFNGDERVFDIMALTPPPTSRLSSVFATEFYLTFILVFISFTLAFDDVDQQKKATMSFKGIVNSKGLTLYAPTPQSKTGFVPIAIGFVICGLCLIGGDVSGGSFNPARVFGPAVVSGRWDSHYLYWIAELSGAAGAAFVRYLFGKYGLPGDLYVKKKRAVPLSIPLDDFTRSASTYSIDIKPCGDTHADTDTGTKTERAK